MVTNTNPLESLPDSHWLTRKQVCRLLDICTDTFTEWAQRQQTSGGQPFNAFKVGRQWRMTVRAVRESLYIPSADEPPIQLETDARRQLRERHGI